SELGIDQAVELIAEMVREREAAAGSADGETR
ncbi:MAG: hypothetical protein KDB13_05660, partial [Microthrixaceae bacterium]|nr:hypothetical protein [Microthrixaceae bacterium]